MTYSDKSLERKLLIRKTRRYIQETISALVDFSYVALFLLVIWGIFGSAAQQKETLFPAPIAAATPIETPLPLDLSNELWKGGE